MIHLPRWIWPPSSSLLEMMLDQSIWCWYNGFLPYWDVGWLYWLQESTNRRGIWHPCHWSETALHSYGIKDAVVCGTVFDGYDASTYSLRLVAEGVYTMVEHGQFYLMRNPQDVSCIPKNYEHLNQIKTLLQPVIHSINNIACLQTANDPFWNRRSARISRPIYVFNSFYVIK